MSLPVVIVTGPMRSGTSAVAAICHRLGFIAATSMSPPRPPRWHSDYEDAEALGHMLAAIWPLGSIPDGAAHERFRKWFPAYLEARLARANYLIIMGEAWINGITLKSPLYAPFLMEMRETIREQTGGIDAIIIVCDRDEAESDASLAAANPSLRLDVLATQKHIRKALASSPTALYIDHCVDFNDMLANPTLCGARIATILGKDSGEGADIAEEIIDPRPA